jgi:hypothetical protein
MTKHEITQEQVQNFKVVSYLAYSSSGKELRMTATEAGVSYTVLQNKNVIYITDVLYNAVVRYNQLP